MEDTNQAIKHRLKRDNFLQKIPKKINKGARIISNETGIKQWIILGNIEMLINKSEQYFT